MVDWKGIGYLIKPTFFSLKKKQTTTQTNKNQPRTQTNLRTKLLITHMHTGKHNVLLSRTSMQALTPLINPSWLQRAENLQKAP